ncbi:stimulated by retinoic acid gene 6 protein-like [Amphiura filiformis]|uniref:stimulated by retinoic acid gene 6 protein-like n=1 Tax=Amphiura filiformis TaxID=82378 RepID=UPI003B21FF93
MVLWALVFLIMSCVVQPFIKGRSTYFTEFLEDYWLTFVVGYVFYYLQVFVSKLFFLQKKGEILSLDNRRVFHVSTFLLFFLNVTIGLVSCLMRIIKALIFGLLYIGRMDRCILMRGWELWDTGYRSYLGFLLLEVTHTHPVLVSFCHILQQSNSKSGGHERYILKTEEAEIETTSTGPNKVARNRWFVAVMLLRNPSIRKHRSPKSKDLDKGEDAMMNEEEPDVSGDNEIEENSSIHNGSNHSDNHSDPPHSQSVSSIVQAAGDAFLESNPANFV